ncbi:histidine phosphatase family protein [Halobacteriaceae archaeon GCM10025711]
MTRVVLVRHGETTWNREGRIQGWAPTGLTDRGAEQAAALADHLAAAYDVDHVRASDLRRTRETAAAIEEAVDAPVRFERAWRERNFGVLQGLAYGEVFGDPTYGVEEGGVEAAKTVPENGESLFDLRERVLDAWTDLTAGAGDGETHVVVTHGGPLYVLLGHLKGLDVVASITEQSQANCAVNEVRVADDATVVRENETTW